MWLYIKMYKNRPSTKREYSKTKNRHDCWYNHEKRWREDQSALMAKMLKQACYYLFPAAAISAGPSTLMLVMPAPQNVRQGIWKCKGSLKQTGCKPVRDRYPDLVSTWRVKRFNASKGRTTTHSIKRSHGREYPALRTTLQTFCRITPF